jgi:predicted DNA-binding transcriptional regulator AlpA
MSDIKLIPLTEVMTRFALSRTSIDRKCKQGIFKKFSLPGSSRVFLDENQIVNAFQPKQTKAENHE